MGKRRTRQEKERALHTFVFTHDVKGQFKIEAKSQEAKPDKPKNADILAKDGNLASIKADILKSLLIASLILGAELVVYLAWF
ncbi:MAG: hypothetical protein ACOYT7_00805 [Patescibacteria group bacterium]